MILNYENHPSIIAIKSARYGSVFYFSEISFNNIYKEIERLKARKAAQSTDISGEIVKVNADIFSVYISDFLNEPIRSGRFSSVLKNANIAVFSIYQ